MNTLNHIQKIVLLSIKKGNRIIPKIQDDTLLPRVVITNTLVDLESRQLIAFRNHSYHPLVHSEHEALWKVDKHEVFSLMNTAYHQDHLNFKLAKFKKDDLIEYNHLNKRLNLFIKECNKQNQIPTKDHVYLFWGQITKANIASQFQ